MLQDSTFNNHLIKWQEFGKFLKETRKQTKSQKNNTRVLEPFIKQNLFQIAFYNSYLHTYINHYKSLA